MLGRNISRAARFTPLPQATQEGVVYQGLTHHWVDDAKRLCVDLRNGRRWGVGRSLLLRVLGKKLVIIAVSQEDSSRLLGVNVYYIERRDVGQRTIHEGFIGVVPEGRGRGISMAMRRHAIEHFKTARLSGITTRISQSNQASMAGARKVGFEPLEEYVDGDRAETRYYLMCRF